MWLKLLQKVGFGIIQIQFPAQNLCKEKKINLAYGCITFRGGCQVCQVLLSSSTDCGHGLSFVYHARRAQAQYSARFSYPYYFVFVSLVLSLAYLKYRP